MPCSRFDAITYYDAYDARDCIEIMNERRVNCVTIFMSPMCMRCRIKYKTKSAIISVIRQLDLHAQQKERVNGHAIKTKQKRERHHITCSASTFQPFTNVLLEKALKWATNSNNKLWFRDQFSRNRKKKQEHCVRNTIPHNLHIKLAQKFHFFLSLSLLLSSFHHYSIHLDGRCVCVCVVFCALFSFQSGHSFLFLVLWKFVVLAPFNRTIVRYDHFITISFSLIWIVAIRIANCSCRTRHKRFQ